jgi:MOSC domain-containing protein YiiM
MDAPLLLSIQVGMPKRRGVVGSDDPMQHPWRSGIFKAPVEGRIWLDTLNLNGDGQADLQNHGGPFRSVLGYSADHYPIWRAELQMPDLPYGAFGENFTIAGLDENAVCIGDVYSIGEVQLEVAQPRRPCWKLARRWNMKDLTVRVHAHGWGGWYHRVLREGYVEAQQPLKLIERPFPRFTITFVNALMDDKVMDGQATRELARCEALSPTWRAAFADRIFEGA